MYQGGQWKRCSSGTGAPEKRSVQRSFLTEGKKPGPLNGGWKEKKQDAVGERRER